MIARGLYGQTLTDEQKMKFTFIGDNKWAFFLDEEREPSAEYYVLKMVFCYFLIFQTINGNETATTG